MQTADYDETIFDNIWEIPQKIPTFENESQLLIPSLRDSVYF